MTESKGSNFWATLPGLVTALAGMGPGTGVIRPIMLVDNTGGLARRITTNGLGPSWGS